MDEVYFVVVFSNPAHKIAVYGRYLVLYFKFEHFAHNHMNVMCSSKSLAISQHSPIPLQE